MSDGEQVWEEEPEYDGPSAPPVFVVLESDLDSHELRGKTTIGKKISDPLKRSIQLPKRGSMGALGKKFFEERSDSSPNPLRKIKKAMPHRSKTDEKEISNYVSLTNNCNGSFSDAEDSLDVSADEYIALHDPEDEILAEEYQLFPIHGEHDIILQHEERPENFIGKKITLIRKEASKKRERASTYLQQVPKNVSSGVATIGQTTQKLKEAVTVDSESKTLRSPRDENGIRHRDYEVVRKKEKRKGSTRIMEKLCSLEEKQDERTSRLSIFMGEQLERECKTLKESFTSVTERLEEQNQDLLRTINELTQQNKSTIELLQSTTKRMDTLEERIIAVQKSQVNQITLFDFLFIILNFIIRCFSLVVEFGNRVISRSSEENVKKKKTKSVSSIMNETNILDDMDDVFD